MDSLITRERTEAKKKGVYAAAAWGGTVLLGIASGPLLAIPAAIGAGYLTASGSCSARSTESGSNRPPRNGSATYLALSRQGDKTMRNGAFGLVGLVLVLAGEIGCSSGDNTVDNGPGDGGDPDTIVDRSKPLSDLTPAELTKICRDLAPKLASVSCDLAGFISAGYAAAYDQSLTDEQIQATCAQTSNTCQNQQPPVDCSDAGPAPTDCTATVDDYFICIDDTLTQIPACGDLTRKLLSAASTSLVNPTSCTTLEAKCPGLDSI